MTATMLTAWVTILIIFACFTTLVLCRLAILRWRTHVVATEPSPLLSGSDSGSGSGSL
jgi:hypothetical protein